MKSDTVTLYGIPNCDTVKKARQWLDEHGVAYRFHDYKKQGVPEPQLDAWIRTLGWERLVNRKGTMWRKLDEAVQAGVTDAASARVLMIATPSVIKRPVVEWGTSTTIGFDPAAWTVLAPTPAR
ncbi:MAG TPA: ArsC family reductase [Burkholderiaceae bacterium]|nr:ArsC family reductase [Burkholderiaceae bacterium]